ncbi:hypothetical protein GYMLUDRAFT_125044, partial [Collybiopsis luxurians FD-317 M1]
SLRGFEIPGMSTPIKASLFADDTATYLSKSDKFSDLLHLLQLWCNASSAKFNVEKTEIIPVGSVAYRNELIHTSKLNPEDGGFPAGTRILNDGESVRYLGAHIGNHTKETTPCLPLIECIESILDHCAESHPTLEAKRHQIQLTIGAITQYLTQANGMPGHVAKHLLSIQKEFL